MATVRLSNDHTEKGNEMTSEVHVSLEEIQRNIERCQRLYQDELNQAGEYGANAILQNHRRRELWYWIYRKKILQINLEETDKGCGCEV